MSTEQIADILAEHQETVTASCGPEGHCDCDAPLDDQSIAAHQAAVLAPFIVAGEKETARQALLDAADDMPLFEEMGFVYLDTGETGFGGPGDWLRARAGDGA